MIKTWPEEEYKPKHSFIAFPDNLFVYFPISHLQKPTQNATHINLSTSLFEICIPECKLLIIQGQADATLYSPLQMLVVAGHLQYWQLENIFDVFASPEATSVGYQIFRNKQHDRVGCGLFVKKHSLSEQSLKKKSLFCLDDKLKDLLW